jgi:hypothetical protein
MANDNGNPFDDESLTNHPSVEAPPADGNPFTDPALTSPEVAQAQAAQLGLPSPEESDFLSKNPGYEHFPSDPKFPNRPAGIYPVGPGNEWRSDPSYSQSPVDLHFAKHTAQYAGASAAGVGAPVVASLAAPELTELAIRHLAGNVLPGLEEEAAKAKLAEIAPKVLQIVKEWALPASAVGGLMKLLSMGGKK